MQSEKEEEETSHQSMGANEEEPHQGMGLNDSQDLNRHSISKAPHVYVITGRDVCLLMMKVAVLLWQ